MAVIQGADAPQEQTIKLEPELRGIAEQALAALELASQKALAHEASPKQYPMPKGSGHLEQLMHARLRQRPAATRRAAVAQILPRLQSGGSNFAPSLTPGLGPAAGVDLRSTTPVADQLERKVPVASFKPQDDTAVAASKAALFTALELRLTKVVCVDETNELGSDEIDLAGVSIDATGDPRKLPRFTVHSDMDSGDKVIYNPPRVFARFPFAADTQIRIDGKIKPVGWPRSHQVTFLLCEVDNGGFPDFVTAVYEKLRTLVAAWVAKAVGAWIGGPIGAAVGAAIGKIAGWVMDKGFAYLVRIWEDDAFTPVTSTIELDGPDRELNGKRGGTVVTSARRWTWKQHGGHYQLYLDWHLTK